MEIGPRTATDSTLGPSSRSKQPGGPFLLAQRPAGPRVVVRDPAMFWIRCQVEKVVGQRADAGRRATLNAGEPDHRRRSATASETSAGIAATCSNSVRMAVSSFWRASAKSDKAGLLAHSSSSRSNSVCVSGEFEHPVDGLNRCFLPELDLRQPILNSVHIPS